MEDLNKLEMGSFSPCNVNKKTKKSISILKLNRGRCDPATCCCGCSCLACITAITSILGALGGLAYLIYYLVSLGNNSGTSTTPSPIG